MIRLAHASDLHCCERMRLDDWRELHRAFAIQMESAGVDVIVLAGDLFHARSTPAERNAMAEFLRRAAEVATVVISKGNHDAAHDLDIFEALVTDHPVHIYDRPGAHLVFLGPMTAERTKLVGILALPWFDRAHLVAGLSAAQDSQATANATIEAARQLLTTLRAEASELRAKGVVPILVGHVMLGGSVVSTGQVLIGQGVELSPSDILDVGCEYAALGHIHKPQSWFGGKVAYSGSTWAQNYGEDHPHGWNLVTFDDEGRFAGVEFKELPSRRIVVFEGQFDAEGKLVAENLVPTLPGDLVRFRYRVPAEALHLIDENKLRQMFEGAHEVALEAIVEQQTRVRSELIVAARDSWSKVLAWLDAKGIDVDEAARARIREKLAAIEDRQAKEVAA